MIVCFIPDRLPPCNESGDLASGKPSSSVCPRQSQNRDFPGAGSAEHGGASTHRGPGRQNVIDQKDTAAVYQMSSFNLERACHIDPALCCGQPCLRGGRLTPANRRCDHRDAGSLRQDSRKPLRLVKSATPSSLPVQRHGNHDVELRVSRQSVRKQDTQRLSQSFYLAVLEKVNEGSQCAIVLAIGPGTVESAQTVAAEPTSAGLIQWVRVQEGSVALNAEIFGDERSRSLQAPGTDWNSGKLREGVAAGAAIFRKDEIERHRDKRSQCGEVEFGLNEL